MRRIGLLSFEAGKFVAGSVHSALQHLHRVHRIVFRDLKPENLLLDSRGYLKLADFGSAKKFHKTGPKRTFSLVGTAHYMAPEVILGSGYSYEYDYWSLGVLLFECLFGPKPFGEAFHDSEHLQIFHTIASADREPPSFRPFRTPQLNEEERALCEKTVSALLCYDPAERASNIRRIAEFGMLAGYDPALIWRRSAVSPLIPTTPSDGDHDGRKYLMLGMLTLKSQCISSIHMTRGKRRRSVVERHIVESEQQKQEIHELQLTVTNLREQLESCRAVEAEVIAGTESGTAGSQQEAGSAYQEVEKLTGQAESLKQRLRALERELENANIRAVAEKERHAKTYKACEVTVRQAEKQLTIVTDALNKAANRITTLGIEVEGLRRQVKDMDRAKSRLADQKTQLDDRSVEIAALRQELEPANEVKAEQACRLEAMCEEKKQLRQEIEELKQAIVSAKASKHNLELHLQETRNTINEKDMQIRLLKAKCVQSSEADKRLQEISKQLEEKSTSLRDAELLIDVLRKETERAHQLRVLEMMKSAVLERRLQSCSDSESSESQQDDANSLTWSRNTLSRQRVNNEHPLKAASSTSDEDDADSTTWSRSIIVNGSHETRSEEQSDSAEDADDADSALWSRNCAGAY
ncbi:hypothetical protein FOZ63_024788 [Perkinsus olseni]|uniref:Protein kinase domain-containing protein n=1 Tax=Perkinsus olseni TaxID=32597 RepID=A0A7J6TU59_PEROL|nr:hypothetical protein FOZ63_024788 [Perkinsus olseni]